MTSNWFVYIVQTKCGKLYTGISTDVDRRFSEHLSKYAEKTGKGAKFFLGHEPDKVVWTLACDSRSCASKKEAQIKKMSLAQKRQLISDC